MQHGLLCWHLHRKSPCKKILPSSDFCHFHCLLAGSVDPPFLWTLLLPIIALCSGWQCLLGVSAAVRQEDGEGMGHFPEPGSLLSPAHPMPSWVLSHCLHAQCSLLLSQGSSEITLGYFQYTQKLLCKTSVVFTYSALQLGLPVPLYTLVLGQPMLLSHANPLSSHSSQ